MTITWKGKGLSLGILNFIKKIKNQQIVSQRAEKYNKIFPATDTSLVLSTIFRESGPNLIGAKDDYEINSFSEGGLDNLGHPNVIAKIKKYLATPLKYFDEAETYNEMNNKIVSADYKAADHYQLYAAYVNMIKDDLVQALKDNEIDEKEVQELIKNKDALRVWQTICFMACMGSKVDGPDKAVGLRTLLEIYKKEKASRPDLSLISIKELNPLFLKYHIWQRSMTQMIESNILDELLGLENSHVKCDKTIQESFETTTCKISESADLNFIDFNLLMCIQEISTDAICQ